MLGRHFTLISDQRSVSFMYETKNFGKIKNEEILRWRMDLASFNYDIFYRPGKENAAPDTLTQAYCAAFSFEKVYKIFIKHYVIQELLEWHTVRSRNLPYSLEEVKKMTASCPDCADLKPKYHKPTHAHLIKATQPFESLEIDFKGPLASASENRYLLTVVDECSRFPFAFACTDMTTPTVIKCLIQLFAIFGMPAYIHSDRGPSFLSVELKQFLHSDGISTSHTTAYYPSRMV